MRPLRRSERPRHSFADRGLGLRGCGLGGSLNLGVAGAAVDRPVAAWLERHLGHHAAISAGGRVHLTRRPAAKAGEDAVAHVALLRLAQAVGLAGRAAGRAAHGLVLEPLAGVELLLATGEDEAVAAVAAGELLVDERHSLVFLSVRDIQETARVRPFSRPDSDHPHY